MKHHERLVATVQKGPNSIVRVTVCGSESGEAFITLRKYIPNGRRVFIPTATVFRLSVKEATGILAALTEGLAEVRS
jgi:hypothetical protein